MKTQAQHDLLLQSACQCSIGYCVIIVVVVIVATVVVVNAVVDVVAVGHTFKGNESTFK